MQLFMRALQATGTELEQLVRQAISSNPALEELSPPEQTDTIPTDTVDADATRRHDAFINNLSASLTLTQHLEQQIRTNALPKDIEAACLVLIENLDQHGRFIVSPQDIAKEYNIELPLLHKALLEVQDLEPAGVGAIDLRDSLILQLRRENEHDSLAMLLLQDYWEELIQHRYDAVALRLHIDTNAIQLAARRIARLNPDPGSAFAKVEQQVITPDIIVTRKGHDLEVQLTDERVPRLTLSADYRNMMAEHADKPELRHYLSRCFREGRELIHALEQRQQTILLVSNAIVSKQKKFFFQGTQAIVPMRMEDIANDTGLHVSTISRAVNGKFLHCDLGVYELRYFFSTSLTTPSGNTPSTSARSVQARIRELIASESPMNPLSDAAIVSALAADGISIARRTVAKYREELRILPAAQRKNAY